MKSFLLSLSGPDAPAAFLLATFTEQHLAEIARLRGVLGGACVGLQLDPDLASQYRLVHDFSLSGLPENLIRLTDNVNSEPVPVPDALLLPLQAATTEYGAEDEDLDEDEDEDNEGDLFSFATDYEPVVQYLELDQYGVNFTGYDAGDDDRTFGTTGYLSYEALGL